MLNLQTIYLRDKKKINLNDVVVDTNFLFALYVRTDTAHKRVQRATEQIRGNLIIPNVVLTETAFLLRRAGGIPAVASFLTVFVASEPYLESVTPTDLIRARDNMNRYPKAQLDFVDCCIAAIAERLNICKIATLDHRDFSIMRPSHCDQFEIIPA